MRSIFIHGPWELEKLKKKELFFSIIFPDSIYSFYFRIAGQFIDNASLFSSSVSAKIEASRIAYASISCLEKANVKLMWINPIHSIYSENRFSHRGGCVIDSEGIVFNSTKKV